MFIKEKEYYEKENYSLDINLKALWEANQDTKYVINHHLQNYEDDNYSLHETFTYKATSDEIINVLENNEFILTNSLDNIASFTIKKLSAY